MPYRRRYSTQPTWFPPFRVYTLASSAESSRLGSQTMDAMFSQLMANSLPA
jgi:hypothetical protein